MTLVAAAMGLVPSARAEPAPIRLGYPSEPGCPTYQEFLRDVTLRVSQAALPYGLDSRLFVVSFTYEAHNVLGRLQIFDNGGSVVIREVNGDSCREVASALALITALSLDPEASKIPVVSSVAALEPATAPPSSVARLPPSPPKPEPVPASFTDGKEGSRSFRWRASVGVSAASMFHVLPDPVFGGGLFLGLSPTGKWVLWPDFRLTAQAASTVQTNIVEQASGIGVQASWLLARLEVCPLRLTTFQSQFSLRGCGSVEGGTIRASGKSLDHAAPVSTRPWSALGPSTRLTWNVNPQWFLEILGGLSFPLSRYNLTYHDNTQGSDLRLFSIPIYGGMLGLGLGYEFP
jgi:hypothetical protein